MCNRYLKGVFLGFCIFFAMGAWAEKQPNVVLVLMDNFGYGEIGVYGGGAMPVSYTHLTLPTN